MPYFHSHIFSVKFPSISDSASNTPTVLLRNDNLPVDAVLKKMPPRHFTPLAVILPVASDSPVAISEFPAIITPHPLPWSTPDTGFVIKVMLVFTCVSDPKQSSGY
jgi:hypothetical protein